MKKPYDFSTFMASLYGFAFTQDNRMPVTDYTWDSRFTAQYSPVKSAVSAAEAMYWDPNLSDPVHLAWTGGDKPKYQALFDRSNEWGLKEYVAGYLSKRKKTDSSRKALYYSERVYPWRRHTPFEGLPEYAAGESVCLKDLPYVESRFNTYHIYPNGSVLYCSNLGQGYIEGFRVLAEMFWDADKDKVTLNVYLCDKGTAYELKEGEVPPEADRLWCKPISTSGEFFHSLYYAKLIYGSISESDFSVLGGHNNRGKRTFQVESFTTMLDTLLRTGKPALSGEHKVVKGRLHTAVDVPAGCEDPDSIFDFFDVWTKAGGYGLATSAELSLYTTSNKIHCVAGEKLLGITFSG